MSNEGKFIMANLTDKIALVTGGSRGIGAGIAKRLAADGASVAITYTKGAEAAAQVLQAIESAGGKAIAIQAAQPMPRPSRPRSNRPSRPSAGSTYGSIMPAPPSRSHSWRRHWRSWTA
jgi:short chain dehydrogenase